MTPPRCHQSMWRNDQWVPWDGVDRTSVVVKGGARMLDYQIAASQRAYKFRFAGSSHEGDAHIFAKMEKYRPASGDIRHEIEVVHDVNTILDPDTLRALSWLECEQVRKQQEAA